MKALKHFDNFMWEQLAVFHTVLCFCRENKSIRTSEVLATDLSAQSFRV